MKAYDANEEHLTPFLSKLLANLKEKRIMNTFRKDGSTRREKIVQIQSHRPSY